MNLRCAVSTLLVWTVFLSQPLSGQPVIESNSPAIEGAILVQSVGLETLGGTFTPLLRKGASVPATVTQVFSTATDDQTQITINLFRGNASTVASATHLGKFLLEGFKSGPRGKPEVEVTIVADKSRILMHAHEKGSNSEVRVTRQSEKENSTGGAWPFSDPRNVAVITLKRITSGQRPILLVTHDADDGQWQFLDGSPATTSESSVVGLGEIVKLDPSLAELADLPLGWRATRRSGTSEWKRESSSAIR